MNSTELANQIYDTLFENGGLSPFHFTLDLDKVENQEICHNVIRLQYEGNVYKIEISEDQPDYFLIEP